MKRTLLSRYCVWTDLMMNHELIEELAELLAVDRQEAGRMLNRFFSAMVSELLAVRKLAIRGVGSFAVMHLPLKKQSNASGTTYTPPSNKLAFDGAVSGADDTVRIAVSRMMMSPAEAERLGRSLATVFSNTVKLQRELRISGLGCFSLNDGVYGFIPERSLEELLNREYQNLEEVILPLHDSSHGTKERKSHRAILPLAALTIGVLVLAALYYGKPGARVSISTPQQVESRVTPAVHTERVTARDHAHPIVDAQGLSKGASADSLVLEKGEYTIILETFQSEQTAQKELARLHAEGIIGYVWPVSANDVKYFRLMTGKYANRKGAGELLKGIPKKIAGSAYIQQVSKRGVFYGEKGL